ncbi:MAG: adenylyl-sulfate kinase [Nitrospiraceae bacterium]|nr:adenylyl-sulfate kinase [Nitrospiraceae bacterium]
MIAPNEMKLSNIKWHSGKIGKKDRWLKNSHKSALVWLTGLSASGKSTVAVELERMLFGLNVNTFVLDGDNVRHGLSRDLRFSPEDRSENLRRIGEVAKLMVEAGVLTIAAFISPYRRDRKNVRLLFQENEFIEVYLRCSIGICEQRDPKGFYRKARAGLIPEFTGISAPYEEPENPEIALDTGNMPVEAAVEKIYSYLMDRNIINASRQSRR